MAERLDLGEIACRCDVQEHQERPPQRLSASRTSAHLRPDADEPGYGSRLRNFEARLDKATAEKDSWSRNARRLVSTWIWKAITFGESAICCV